MINVIQIGDTVCFGERLGDFGKIPRRVIGVEQREDGLWIKTDHSRDYAPASMFDKCN